MVFSDSMDSLTPGFRHMMEEKGSSLIVMCKKGAVKDAASSIVTYKGGGGDLADMRLGGDGSGGYGWGKEAVVTIGRKEARRKEAEMKC
ncbi:hypothetical protein ACE6H2_012009 [Prunus campanulata]